MKRCIESAIEGNSLALQNLVEILKPRIMGMAVYYARRCGEDADDLLQEAWLGLLEALPELDMRIGTPEQYLIRRAKWRLLDAVKRSRVRRCDQLTDITTESHVCLWSHLSADGVGLSEFSSRLNSTQRMVLECLLDGLTWREVGDVLGCTSANIAYHVRQIRRHYHDWEVAE